MGCRFYSDTSRSLPPGNAGIFRRQRTLTVTNIDQKIAVQKAGLAVGWVPEPRVRSLLETGELIALTVHEPRQPIMLHLARHSDDQGKALMWFWEYLTHSTTLSDWLD